MKKEFKNAALLFCVPVSLTHTRGKNVPCVTVGTELKITNAEPSSTSFLQQALFFFRKRLTARKLLERNSAVMSFQTGVYSYLKRQNVRPFSFSLSTHENMIRFKQVLRNPSNKLRKEDRRRRGRCLAIERIPAFFHSSFFLYAEVSTPTKQLRVTE